MLTEVAVKWPVFHDSIEILMVEVNIKCHPNCYHSNVKTRWISVHQMNIQLILFISSFQEIVYSFHTSTWWYASTDFPQLAKIFFIFLQGVFFSFVKISLLNIGQLHCCFINFRNLYEVLTQWGERNPSWRAAAWPHFFGGKQWHRKKFAGMQIIITICNYYR